VIVSDQSLRRFLADGTIVVEPLEDYQIQPASIDLRLGGHFLKLDENRMDAIDLGRELEYIEIRREEIIIPPNSFLLHR
jgi:dCTP deaminase